MEEIDEFLIIKVSKNKIMDTFRSILRDELKEIVTKDSKINVRSFENNKEACLFL